MSGRALGVAGRAADGTWGSGGGVVVWSMFTSGSLDKVDCAIAHVSPPLIAGR
jgi:hypothetical protein